MSTAWREVLERVTLARVWAALGGGPIRNRRGQAFWRNGDGWNIALDEPNKVWFDFVGGRGGGILNLVMVALGCDKAAAVSWLSQMAGVTLDDSGDSVTYAARRNRGRIIAQRVADWANGTAEQLDEQKRAALDAGDMDALACAARALYLLERADPRTLLEQFRADPDADRHERAGREMRRRADEATQMVVEQISEVNAR